MLLASLAILVCLHCFGWKLSNNSRKRSHLCLTKSMGPGPRSTVCFRGVSEKIAWDLENGGLHNRQPFAIKRTALIGWKSFKMVASIPGSHLQFKEWLSLAQTDGHFWGALGHFCLLSQKRNAIESTLKRTMTPNWQKKLLWSCLGGIPWTWSRLDIHLHLFDAVVVVSYADVITHLYMFGNAM